ncbi:HD domain-containing protein [Streptococcus pneumoniae]
MERLKQQWAFAAELEKLKAVHRTNRTLDNYRFENSAEHSFQGAILVPLLSEHLPFQVNLEKVMKLLLFHDLGEIYAGDTLVFDEIGKVDSYLREQDSLRRSLGLLPSDQEEEYLALWEEFEEGKTREAQYARMIDALVPLINHLEVAKEGDNPYQLTKSQVLAKKSFIKELSPTLWNLVLEIIDKSVAKGLYMDQ